MGESGALPILWYNFREFRNQNQKLRSNQHTTRS